MLGIRSWKWLVRHKWKKKNNKCAIFETYWSFSGSTEEVRIHGGGGERKRCTEISNINSGNQKEHSDLETWEFLNLELKELQNKKINNSLSLPEWVREGQEIVPLYKHKNGGTDFCTPVQFSSIT